MRPLIGLVGGSWRSMLALVMYYVTLALLVAFVPGVLSALDVVFEPIRDGILGLLEKVSKDSDFVATYASYLGNSELAVGLGIIATRVVTLPLVLSALELPLRLFKR
jgi:uncharacterized membrane protein